MALAGPGKTGKAQGGRNKMHQKREKHQNRPTAPRRRSAGRKKGHTAGAETARGNTNSEVTVPLKNDISVLQALGNRLRPDLAQARTTGKGVAFASRKMSSNAREL